LNDELINYFIHLVRLRDNDQSARFALRRLASKFYVCQFFDLLLSGTGVYNYSMVARFTRRSNHVNIFELNKLFVPVHPAGSHWALVVVDMRRKRIEYYDSMDGSGLRYCQTILRYLRDEGLRFGIPVMAEEWSLFVPMRGVPKQRNGCDCGVFLCIFVLLLAEGVPLRFDQLENTPKHIISEL
jgi:sentrin-specific protease 1